MSSEGSINFPFDNSYTALHDSAFLKNEGTPQVVSEVRDNNGNFARVRHFIHHAQRKP